MNSKRFSHLEFTEGEEEKLDSEGKKEKEVEEKRRKRKVVSPSFGSEGGGSNGILKKREVIHSTYME